MSKGNSSRKGIVLTFPDYSPSLREVRAGTKAEVMEECCLLVCSYMDSSACFLLCPRTTTCTEVATTELAGSSHINHYENALQTCLQANLMGKLSLLKVPFPKQSLTCVKLITSELRQYVYCVFHSWCSFLLCTGFDWLVLTVSCCPALYVWLMVLDCD